MFLAVGICLVNMFETHPFLDSLGLMNLCCLINLLIHPWYMLDSLIDPV